MRRVRGTVYLVGSGPGDPGLITVRGWGLVKSADVIVYDRLIPRELLTLAAPKTELIDAGKSPGHQKLSQEEINAVLVDRAKHGLHVVRLKGGDPFVFGRGFEESAACAEAGVKCVVVPGVTSAIAGPAAAGIPVTARGAARSFVVVTAETAPDQHVELDYAALAGIDTIVVLMGRANLRNVAEGLLAAGRDPQTPAACIERATTRQQRVERAALATIADAADVAGLSNPMITVVGEVAGYADANIESDVLPLSGKRIVITRPRSTASGLERQLAALGASPISLPLIRIEYCNEAELDARLAVLHTFQWVVFSSVHGVRAVRHRMQALELDGRAFATCRIAAIGEATAGALTPLGLRADAVSSGHTGEDLVAAVLDAGVDPDANILFPCGDRGGTEIFKGLSLAGATVDLVTAYATVDVQPPQGAMDMVAEGVDAVLFFSPSAVRQFAHLGLDPEGATIACIGPTTAQAAEALGMRVDVIASAQTNTGLIAALVEHFRVTGVHR